MAMFPVLYSMSLHFILYTVVCTSQSSTPVVPLSPLVTTLSSLYLQVCFLLLQSLVFLHSHVRNNIQYLSFSDLHKHSTLEIHPCCCTWQNFIFLWLSSIPLYTHYIFIHSSVDGHLGCFHVLAIVNSAAVNIEVHVFFRLWFSLGICPEGGLLDYMVALYLVL